jgi:hypothetical protein
VEGLVVRAVVGWVVEGVLEGTVMVVGRVGALVAGRVVGWVVGVRVVGWVVGGWEEVTVVGWVVGVGWVEAGVGWAEVGRVAALQHTRLDSKGMTCA